MGKDSSVSSVADKDYTRLDTDAPAEIVDRFDGHTNGREQRRTTIQDESMS